MTALAVPFRGEAGAGHASTKGDGAESKRDKVLQVGRAASRHVHLPSD